MAHDQQQLENLRVKERVCEEVEQLAKNSKSRTAAVTLRRLQRDWESVGPIPPDREAPLERRFQHAVKTIRTGIGGPHRMRLIDALERREQELYRVIDALARANAQASDLVPRVSGSIGGRIDLAVRMHEKWNRLMDRVGRLAQRRNQLREEIADIRRKLSGS